MSFQDQWTGLASLQIIQEHRYYVFANGFLERSQVKKAEITQEMVHFPVAPHQHTSAPKNRLEKKVLNNAIYMETRQGLPSRGVVARRSLSSASKSSTDPSALETIVWVPLDDDAENGLVDGEHPYLRTSVVQPGDFRFEPKQLWFGLRVHCQTWDFMGEAHWGRLWRLCVQQCSWLHLWATSWHTPRTKFKFSCW